MTLTILKWAIGTLIILGGLLVPFHVSPPEPLIAHAQATSTPVKAIECEKPLTTDQCRIRERIRSEFADYPAFVGTVSCESHFRQYDRTGAVLTSSTTDVGIAQINVKTWGQKAKELGYDIYSEDGNLLMARHVLTVQGITAWVCYNNIAGGR